jgi:hypothetical protein
MGLFYLTHTLCVAAIKAYSFYWQKYKNNFEKSCKSVFAWRT